MESQNSAQGVVVLHGEQQLEGAEVAVGGQAARPCRGRRLERGGLERPARLVVAAAGLAGADGAAGAGRQVDADLAADRVAHALGELEELVLVAGDGSSAQVSVPVPAARPPPASRAAPSASAASVAFWRRAAA